jgi:hypothetical protein
MSQDLLNLETCDGYLCNIAPEKLKMLKDGSQSSCFNAPLKARRRAMYASTKLKKDYCTTSAQYMYNRCKTFNQKSFNYLSGYTNEEDRASYLASFPNASLKPGAPLSQFNKYRGNCAPSCVAKDNDTVVPVLNGCTNSMMTNTATNINALKCDKTIYKPNNSNYAKQGPVSSSERLLRLNMDTINKNIANIKDLKKEGAAYLRKNKYTTCNNSYVIKLDDKKLYKISCQ